MQEGLGLNLCLSLGPSAAAVPQSVCLQNRNKNRLGGLKCRAVLQEKVEEKPGSREELVPREPRRNLLLLGLSLVDGLQKPLLLFLEACQCPLPWLLWGAGHVQASSGGLPELLSLLSSAYIPGTGTGLRGNKMLQHPSKPLA